jgi:uncharacterized protein (DUF58 family)
VLFSPASLFGSSKARLSVQLVQLAATLAADAMLQRESIAAICVVGQQRFSLRPSSGQRAYAGLLHVLREAHQALLDGGANAPMAGAAPAGLLARGSEVYLLGDQWALQQLATDGIAPLRQRASLVRPLAVADPLELGLPPPDRYPLQLGGLRFEVDFFASKERQRALNAIAERQAQLVAAYRQHGLGYQVLPADGDALSFVLGLAA